MVCVKIVSNVVKNLYTFLCVAKCDMRGYHRPRKSLGYRTPFVKLLLQERKELVVCGEPVYGAKLIGG